VATPGYSGKPLYEKLGLKPGMQTALEDVPADYVDLLGAPFEVSEANEDVEFIHWFGTDRDKLEDSLIRWRHKVHPSGMMWISWPKKASKVPTNITEDTIRELCLPLGWVDVKVCAVSEVWSGLKLVIRRELR
jgi:hypothetical protein